MPAPRERRSRRARRPDAGETNLIRAALIALTFGSPAVADGILEAHYEEPTTRYAHSILGDDEEWGTLVMRTTGGKTIRVRLPERLVFEDVAPRVVDVDGDGEAEVIVVESDAQYGARLSVYDATGAVAATDFIGQPNRWLAPIGAADLDGDGTMEIAFVDRPHLAKTLKVVRFRTGRMRPIAELPGVTNHRIGETDIAGGIRDCGDGPEMIVASADWTSVLAVAFDGRAFTLRKVGAHEGRESFAEAMECAR